MEILNAKITSVSISMADHGCLTFTIFLEGEGWGVGYGGYCIGHGYLGADDFKAKNGKGLEAMMRIMDTVGAEKWEQLPGKYVRVKTNGWGDTVDIIGNLIKDKWFNIKEFFESNKKEQKDKCFMKLIYEERVIILSALTY